jgi:hypothetical protein
VPVLAAGTTPARLGDGDEACHSWDLFWQRSHESPTRDNVSDTRWPAQGHLLF